MARTDFHQTADRAAALVADATAGLRAIAATPLPAPHRRHISSALRHLEDAQQELFVARNDPFGRGTAVTARPRQLELL